MITCLCLLLCNQTLGQPAVLLDPDLEPVSVELGAISPSTFKVIDTQGNEQSLKHEEVLRLSLTGNHRATPSTGRSKVKVTLCDGQVIVGGWFGGGDRGESIIVGFGDKELVVELSLDDLLSIAGRPDAAVPSAGDDDALLLATGETLTGFVEFIGDEAIDFVIGDAKDAIKIPLERIEGMSIANKPQKPEAKPGTLRVKTTDGSVLMVEGPSLKPGDNGALLTGVSTLPIRINETNAKSDDGASAAAASRISLSLNRVSVIEPIGTRHRLTALSDVAWELVEGGEVFGVAMPPRALPKGDLWLHAPTTLAYDLPDGATRLALTVAMDLDSTIPESRRRLAGCELVVTLGDQVIARHTLTADGPPKRLNLPLNARDLRMALDPGVNGPVLDRVVVTQAELLVSNR